MSYAGITLAELLDDNILSTEKWRAWFAVNPGALDIPCDIYNSGSVRGFLRHIFAVELRHSQRLAGGEVADYDAIPMGTLDDLFSTHAQAIANLREFLARSSDAALGEEITVQTVSAGTLHGSRRKLFVHVMLHSIRHWAQMTTHLRTHGFATDWAKDFFVSEAMQ
jgi:uncharacterized damage-inducible protein DinB